MNVQCNNIIHLCRVKEKKTSVCDLIDFINTLGNQTSEIRI